MTEQNSQNAEQPEIITSESRTTKFQNIKYFEDGSEGAIRTLSQFSVWDVERRDWSEKPKVVFRNIMLCALHPSRDFCLTEISTRERNWRKLDAFKPPSDSKPWFLDLASGARTDGRFTFSRGSTIGKLYYGSENSENWKRIIYGSILHTGCKKLIYKEMNYVVVDDEGLDENGDHLDDTVNNIHWNTGDSHAKASSRLMNLLEISESSDGEIPIQFRAALLSISNNPGWVGKGTVSYNPLCDAKNIDLVIPLSSLKGNKPALGNHQAKLLMGTVFEAEERKTKLGWMIWQWFAFETLEQDEIISKLRQKAQKLRDAFNSIQNLAEILRIDQQEAEKDFHEQEGQDLDTDSYKTPALKIIKADRRGLLLLHPYIISRVKDGIQEMWLNLAKSAGVKFHSVMAQPDEYFMRYHSVTQNGRIEGRKVFCCASFSPGDYIVFCNPMRHWGDIQIWENRHEGLYTRAIGTIATSRALLASLGRDTDGDYIQLIKANRYPGMKATILNFDRPPTVSKFPKVPLEGNLQRIAIGSMNDLTGVVASLLGRARAANAEQQVLLIPPGGRQRVPVEMRIIEFLSQELQIAVDSLKSAYPNNEAGIRAVTEFLNSIGAEAPWLSDLKNDLCYKNRPCNVNPEAVDTVSRIVQLVNSYYRNPEIGMERSPRLYMDVLFNTVRHETYQYSYAKSELIKYREQMRQAEEVALREGGDDSYIVNQLKSQYKKQVANNFRERKQEVYETLSPDGEKYSPESWVSAYWKASHDAESGSAPLVFSVFTDEIIAKLKENEDRLIEPIEVFNSRYEKEINTWKRYRFTGQRVQFRAYVNHEMGRLVIGIRSTIVDMEFRYIGIVGETSLRLVRPGDTGIARICTHRIKNNDMSAALLFPPDATYEEAIQKVKYNFYREQWPD